MCVQVETSPLCQSTNVNLTLAALVIHFIPALPDTKVAARKRPVPIQMDVQTTSETP